MLAARSVSHHARDGEARCSQEAEAPVSQHSRASVTTGAEVVAFAIPVMKRPGGFMLAVPVDVFTGECLISGEMADDDVEVGPHLRTSALLVEEGEDGMEKITGIEVECLLVDLSDMALSWMTEYDPVTDSTMEIIGFT